MEWVNETMTIRVWVWIALIMILPSMAFLMGRLTGEGDALEKGAKATQEKERLAWRKGYFAGRAEQLIPKQMETQTYKKSVDGEWILRDGGLYDYQA